MTAHGVVATQPPVVPDRPERDVVFRHRAQYAALRATIGALGALGFQRSSDVGARIGAWGYSPLGIRRRVVEKQLAAAFPEWSSERVHEVARASYEHFGRTTIEAAVLPRYDSRKVLELVDDPPEWHLIDSALSRGRGVILVAGHLGNWELAGNYLAARGLRMHAVARQMENPLFDRYLNRTRGRLGVEAIWDGDAVRRVPRVLKENGAVALLMDQGAAGLASSWVPFFGRMAKTPRGPGVFALRLRTPVVFVAPLRKPDGRFTMGLEEIPVTETGDRNADVDRIVAGYTAALERWVRRAPEQYFWHHRRWKHQLPDTPPELGDPLK
ncbi:MAG TPA: lysophospholipid acyltransferase family protein [Gemmatimonadaceae bacterium]|nr:lysophospholipid acyltransferase family protein [Gemmatimonadaceae bacterium]